MKWWEGWEEGNQSSSECLWKGKREEVKSWRVHLSLVVTTVGRERRTSLILSVTSCHWAYISCRGVSAWLYSSVTGSQQPKQMHRKWRDSWYTLLPIIRHFSCPGDNGGESRPAIKWGGLGGSYLCPTISPCAPHLPASCPSDRDFAAGLSLRTLGEYPVHNLWRVVDIATILKGWTDLSCERVTL